MIWLFRGCRLQHSQLPHGESSASGLPQDDDVTLIVLKVNSFLAGVALF